MEFANRGQQPVAAPAGRPTSSRRPKGKLARVAALLSVVAVAVLLGLLIFLIGLNRPKSEGQLVDSNKYQAVFLNGGQVYFGKVRELNKQYVTLDSIYYLRVNEQAAEGEKTNQQTTNSNQQISLAKLGCELHGPEDKMVINREQVTFWENLKDDGQVAKAIAQFIQQNPNGQNCNAQQQS